MTEVIEKSIACDQLLKATPEEDRFGTHRNDLDYVSNGQIMVTITLAEYRDLVKTNADKEVSEANSKRYDVERERDGLKKQVEDLRKQLNELRTMIASAVPVKVSVNTDAQAVDPAN